MVPCSRAKRLIHLPVLPDIDAPQQTRLFHQTQNLEIGYLLYDLPIQKVLRLKRAGGSSPRWSEPSKLGVELGLDLGALGSGMVFLLGPRNGHS